MRPLRTDIYYTSNQKYYNSQISILTVYLLVWQIPLRMIMLLVNKFLRHLRVVAGLAIF